MKDSAICEQKLKANLLFSGINEYGGKIPGRPVMWLEMDQ
jgi:hypothetical protein